MSGVRTHPSGIVVLDLPEDFEDGETPRERFRSFMAAATAALAPGQFYCVIGPDDRVVAGTRSKDFAEPVRCFCDTHGCDWDQATDVGYRLGLTGADA